jgi:hypothetical protein
MKIKIAKYLLSALIGAFIFAQFQPKPNEQEVVQTQKQDCKIVVKKVTKPNGEVDEVTEFLSSNSQKQEIKPKQKKNLYGLGLKHEYSFKNQSSSYEVSISRSIQDNLDLVFSYSTEQVAGVGIVVRF